MGRNKEQRRGEEKEKDWDCEVTKMKYKEDKQGGGIKMTDREESETLFKTLHRNLVVRIVR